jgi:hypothetical protein
MRITGIAEGDVVTVVAQEEGTDNSNEIRSFEAGATG